MGHLPEREVCYMRRHIDFDKIGITDDVMSVSYTHLPNFSPAEGKKQPQMPEYLYQDALISGQRH